MTESALGFENRAAVKPRTRALDRPFRRWVHAHLATIEAGLIKVVDGGEEASFGNREGSLRATVHVHDRRFYREVALRGAIGAAEAYMEGFWRCDDLSSLIRIIARSRDTQTRIDGVAARWRRPLLAFLHMLRSNTRGGSRKNIAAHYDLGNEFFEAFLDPTLTYSAGVFESPDATMEEASAAKYERACRKLRLGQRDHVLEIGTGWGGFALHAARQYGCRVTTTTISRQQYEKARARVAEAGLEDKVEVLFEDYRNLRGQYDKLVSIEMIEAVGHENLGRFFRVCGERLKPDGVMFLQAITVPDQDFELHTRSVDFIKRYIFPGGELVSVGAVNESAARNSDLRMTHLEDLTPHYAETLRRWRRRLHENISTIRSLGLDDRFIRMWEYYFCYCEGGFEEREIGLMQAVFEKRGFRGESLLGRFG